MRFSIVSLSVCSIKPRNWMHESRNVIHVRVICGWNGLEIIFAWEIGLCASNHPYAVLCTCCCVLCTALNKCCGACISRQDASSCFHTTWHARILLTLWFLHMYHKYWKCQPCLVHKLTVLIRFGMLLLYGDSGSPSSHLMVASMLSCNKCPPFHVHKSIRKLYVHVAKSLLSLMHKLCTSLRSLTQRNWAAWQGHVRQNTTINKSRHMGTIGYCQ